MDPASTNILKVNVQRFSMSDIDSNKYINFVRMKKKLNKMNSDDYDNKTNGKVQDKVL